MERGRGRRHYNDVVMTRTQATLLVCQHTLVCRLLTFTLMMIIIITMIVMTIIIIYVCTYLSSTHYTCTTFILHRKCFAFYKTAPFALLSFFPSFLAIWLKHSKITSTTEQRPSSLRTLSLYKDHSFSPCDFLLVFCLMSILTKRWE